MTLTLYNTLTRSKQAFTPLAPGQVRMYCCGVTVYDYSHLGHARSSINWDTIRRYLEWQGYAVTYVQNFTDIDDKILNRARTEGSSMEAVSEKYIAAYLEDMDRLNVKRATDYPRATHSLDGIKRLIHELEQKGAAYAAEGDVYYSVRQKVDYGKLSGRKLADLEAGASGRVDEADARKRDPFDFALWKAAKPGEPSWESPWGPGRPGWHIECSAMVRDRLGDTIDLHVGGADLIFPHHENEIAQSEAVTGKPLSIYWMHNGMVNVEGTKMSKSLGNFTTIRDLMGDGEGQVPPMVIRLLALGAQYRKPIDFTADAVTAATNGWKTLCDGLLFGPTHGQVWGGSLAAATDRAAMDTDAVAAFNTAMDDDFNTSSALAVLYELAKKLQREGNQIVHGGQAGATPAELQQQWQTLVALADVLGLVATVEAEAVSGLSDTAIEGLIADRAAAKQAKNFGEADRLRDQLKTEGIALVDQPGGKVTWHRG
jgi:cysteinyl-tRNA synthetase